jgi:hypothetical protein
MANGMRLILLDLANTYNIKRIEMAGTPVEYDPFAPQPKAVDIDPFASKKPMGYGEMLKQAVVNTPASAGRMVSGLYEAVTSPVQTVSGLMDVAAGGLQNVLPKPVTNFINQFETNPEAAQRAVNTANAMGGMYKERYGTLEGIKNTIATDPVGVAGDLSTLLAGGAGLARGASAVAGPGRVGSTISSVADKLSTASNVTNPINAMVKAPGMAYDLVGALTKQGLALKTGVGAEPITQAVKAGREGNTTVLANMREQVPITQVLDDARSNLSKMNLDKQKDYRSGMVNIKNDKSVLDFAGIDKAIKDAENLAYFKGKVKDKTAASVLNDIKAKVSDWKKSDPAEYHTPEGMDNLKQSLWEDFGKLGREEKTAFSAGKQIYDAVKNQINTQAPEYSKVMKNYSEASDQIKEIERALSLGNTASADTAMRKLQSLMRNNVNTNYGQRLELAKQLEAMGGNEIMPALAGQALSSKLPRGLQSATNIPSSYLAFGVGGPALAALDLAASSPRLVGEAAYKYGQMANALNKAKQPVTDITKQLPMTAQQAKLAALLAAQSNQPARIELNNMLPNRP